LSKIKFVCEFQNATKDDPVTLLVPGTTQQQPPDEMSERQTKPGIVSWSPPQPNWNPWTSCNIDEGPLATVTTSVYVLLSTNYRLLIT